MYIYICVCVCEYIIYMYIDIHTKNTCSSIKCAKRRRKHDIFVRVNAKKVSYSKQKPGRGITLFVQA